MLVLGMVARSRGEVLVAQLLQLAADGGLIERDREFVRELLDKINQAPAHDPMDRWDRSAFDHIYQRLALRTVKPGTGARRLAVQQAIGATRIEPEDPVSHDLKSDPANPSRGCLAATVANLGQCKKPSRLARALRSPRQSAQRGAVKLIPQADG